MIITGVIIFVVLLVGAVAWVGVRGYLAKGELEAALPLASQLKSQVADGDAVGAAASASGLASHASEAAALTSDPIWRAAELVPWVGQNLTVMRELSSTVDNVSRFGIGPLTSLAGSIGLSDFKPADGRVDLQPLVDAQPALAESSTSVEDAITRVQAIDTDGTLQPLIDARQKLLDSLLEASSGLTVLNKAAQLMPAMLGADGPRNYLVLFQNNAELRSTGGIPGAMAMVQTDGGSMSLTQQTSASSFPKFPAPVVELPQETRALYGDHTAQYMQDVNFTPNFALSGQIAREMWNRKYGVQVDGVISLDPVALSYLLRATGPVTLPTGDQLTSDNAVKLLLEDVYARYKNPTEQDAFFASAASAVFEKIATGSLEPQALISALTKAGEENRILIWSSHDEDQAVLADTTLAGGLPVSDEAKQNFGVYFNDSTTAKMDPYLQVSIAAGQKVCRNDGLPSNSVRVTLTNTAPADAATSLPDYVTGGGLFGIPQGNIRTNVAAYGAPGLYNLGVSRDGARIAYQGATDEGYGVSKVEVELAPGESTVLDFQYLGDVPSIRPVTVQHTPLVNPIETLPLDVDCGAVLK
ncbi:Protein of unknown function [Agreia bicolorata]|uniref:DUF4012 domain-containing protein n=1 Tax=Agreia bicolorata TaxID=110935 RepID=A0A1T4WY95_9MICO|nr:DUF4012 domain-containing protein [Agreia bicolorata]SKA82296.1 Protein of unknown function [Agreia bicolorata]